jgi:hypothetical protein
MTGDELRSIRKEILCLGTPRFARLIGASDGSTVRQWEKQNEIPEQIAIIAGLIRDLPEARALLLEERLHGKDAPARASSLWKKLGAAEIAS